MDSDRATGIADLSAREIRELVATRRLGPTEVVADTLERIEAADPDLHSLTRVTAERAWTDAARLERDLAAGAVPGPLCGVPFTVKDTIPTAGGPCSCGSLLFRDSVPGYDALCVRRLVDAGAILVGTSNLPELAALPRTVNRLGPECRNPRDPERVAGGSSGGAAAGVAAGLVPVAIGTDAGGSNRIPAAYCGVVGLAPTLGRVPHRGGYRSSPFVTVTGPLTRNVGDAATVMEVLAPPDPDDPVALASEPPGFLAEPADGRSLRVRWAPRSGVDEHRDQRVVDAVGRAVGAAFPTADDGGALGAAQLLAGFVLMLNTGRLRQVRHYLDDPTSRALMSAELVTQLDAVRSCSALDHAEAVEGRLTARTRLNDLLRGYDVVASPTVAFVAPPRSDPTVLLPAMEYTFLASYAGYPSISVPVGSVDGLPVGMQIIGRPDRDAVVLRAAAAVAAAHDGTR